MAEIRSMAADAAAGAAATIIAKRLDENQASALNRRQPQRPRQAS